ncbi:uncharacterized protein [Lepeophtheirus salmonis]|uniref:uncharacterized protein n=1 Tax=Lepeophtheirus salmonis TaxID=72036 RepID=UPI001AE86CDA|nr:uncharacterized protein LOC121117563 [Lepeophtheirus salmonis]
MGGKEIEFSTQMKYLGVVFDKGLTWMEHLKEKAAKVSRIWNMVKAVIGQKWGLASEKVLWLYEAMVRAIISYGCLIRGHSITTKKSAIKILNKIQRKVLLAMTQTLRSTPTAGNGIPTKSRWRTRHFLVDTWDGIGNLPTRRGHPFSSDKIITELQLNQSSDYIKDRSKDEEANTGTGWAITPGDTSLHQSNESLNKEATVLQAEVFAIARSVEALTRMEKPSGDVIIRSDSQSTIAAILNPFTKNWCKGHCDITGNEFADYLAKRGVKSQNTKLVGVSPSYIKKKINGFFYVAWCKRYRRDQSVKHTHLMLAMPQDKSLKYERGNMKLIVQVYTGHGPFLAHLSKWKSTSATCNVCMEELQTADHLINRCPSLSYTKDIKPLKKRMKYFVF